LACCASQEHIYNYNCIIEGSLSIRDIDKNTKKDVNKHSTNCVYEIIKSSGKGSVGVEEKILSSTLKEVGEILNIDYRTVKRHLDSLSEQELGRSF
jgi:hypothetical protein